MPALHIILEEPAWPDLASRERVVHHAGDISVTALPHGMESGATSIAIRIDLEDGTTVIAETSLALWLAAGRAISARYPSPPGTGENAP